MDSKDTLAYPDSLGYPAVSSPIHDPLRAQYDDQKLEHGIKREMKARHIAMISIGGTIGTGLFLLSGSTIATAGPLGALIAYLFMGGVVFCVMTALGEMATLIPITGSFNHYAARFIDPALGFALGWNYWISWGVTIATELAAAGTIIGFWKEIMPTYIWSLIILAVIVFFNLFGGRGYGETEYWLSLIKIVTVVVFIIVGVIVASGGLGGVTYGFTNWTNPQPILTTGNYSPGANAFVNIATTMINVGFSYMGTELVGIAAGETANPRKSVPRAIRNVFWRILIFFCLSIFIMGLCIASGDPTLGGGSTAAISPFTQVFALTQGPNATTTIPANIINGILLTVIVSASNSALYCGSRTLMAMARENKAPKIFGWVTKRGVPVPAILLTGCFGIIIAAGSAYGTQAVMNWVVALSSISGFISWSGIGFTHFRFRRAYVAQGRDVAKLPYQAWGFPFSSLFGASVTGLLGLTYGLTAIWPVWEIDTFFQDYLPLFVFVILYLGYKFRVRFDGWRPVLVFRTVVVPLLECDFDTGVRWAEISHEQDTYVKRPRTVGSVLKACFGQFIG